MQSPLPRAMGTDAEQRVFDAVRADKDVDGFHPHNVGLLVQKRARLVACTPSGVIELLAREGIPIAGRHAVVIGRSDIVGKPMALLLLHRDATVTICHSRTPDVAALARQADVVVAGVGRAGFVTPAFVRPGATVVDVGINRVTDAAMVAGLYPDGHPRRRQFDEKGSLVVGDVHPAVEAVAGALTPVPGGVGPLTIAMLLHNTVVAAEDRAAPAPAGDADAAGRPDRRDRDRQEHHRRRASRPRRAGGRRRRAGPRGGGPGQCRACARSSPASAHGSWPPTADWIGPGSAGSSSPMPPPDTTSNGSCTPASGPASPRSSRRPATRPAAVAEIPLVYESGWHRAFDAVVVAACHPRLQLARLRGRDRLDEAEARARLAAQWPIEDKARLADRVVLTDGTLEDTARQTEALARWLLGAAAAG